MNCLLRTSLSLSPAHSLCRQSFPLYSAFIILLSESGILLQIPCLLCSTLPVWWLMNAIDCLWPVLVALTVAWQKGIISISLASYICRRVRNLISSITFCSMAFIIRPWQEDTKYNKRPPVESSSTHRLPLSSVERMAGWLTTHKPPQKPLGTSPAWVEKSKSRWTKELGSSQNE